MARAKKTETKKTTTKKTTKKSTKNVVEEFPVDDIINDLKGTLITENSDQVGCKKKFKDEVEEKQQETIEVNTAFEDESIEKCVNTEGDIEAVETVNVDEIVEKNADELKKEIKEEAYEEKVEQITEEVNQKVAQKVADILEDFSVEEIQQEEEEKEKKIVENKDKTFLKKARKIVTNHKWMGQIIDF